MFLLIDSSLVLSTNFSPKDRVRDDGEATEEQNSQACDNNKETYLIEPGGLISELRRSV